MELVITQESFKDQAKKLHASLKSRGVELKLSDVQESLAVSLGHRSLAALYGMLKQDSARIVDAAPLLLQVQNHFIVSWQYFDDIEDEEMVVYPAGTSLNDLATRDWRKAEKVRASAVRVPDEIKLEGAVVFENYSEISDITKYGIHDGAHESTVTDWVLEYFTFRVPSTGVKVQASDNGGDGATKDHFHIWVSDEQAKQLRALFE